jgi:hypothetical protein
MGRIITFLKKKDLYLGLVRYLLGLNMIAYGLTKILRTQFVVIPFSLWQRPLESISGRTLAWAFLGFSHWFEVMLGFLELIPAILLLFRRTTLAGAILLLPMTLNVYLINQALNLWDDTKTISLILLSLNCIILLFEWKRIKEFILIVICKGKKFKFTIIEIAINLIVVIALFYSFSRGLFDYRNQKNFLTGDWYNQHPNEWVLQSEKINDSTLHPRTMKMYFDTYGQYSEINDTGYIKSNTFSYTLDEKAHTLNFVNNQNRLGDYYTYKLLSDSILRLEKTIDTSKNVKLIRIYKRRVIVAGYH